MVHVDKNLIEVHQSRRYFVMTAIKVSVLRDMLLESGLVALYVSCAAVFLGLIVSVSCVGSPESYIEVEDNVRSFLRRVHGIFFFFCELKCFLSYLQT